LAAAANLNGTIYDQTGGVIPKAMVTLSGLENGYTQTIAASEAGGFAFNTLAPGRYRLEVRSPGFAPYNQENLKLDVDSNIKTPVFLRLGVTRETIEVSSSAPAGVKPQTAVNTRIRAGGRVQPVKLAVMPRVPYPEQAKARAIQGTVTFHATIEKDGSIANLFPATDADPVLAEAAAETVRNWRYQPAMLNGQPVATEAVISINFRLQ
jgi:TonB family protein